MPVVFDKLDRLIENFKISQTNFCFILHGPPGTGKSHRIRKSLKKEKTYFFKGRLTAPALFQTLQEYSEGYYVVFSDVDGVFDSRSLEIIKAVTDDEDGERKVSWVTKRGKSEFVFNGKIIILTNKDYSGPHWKAISSRSESFYYKLTEEEFFSTAMKIAKNGMTEIAKEVAQEMIDHRMLDLRKFRSFCETACNNPEDWRILIQHHFKVDDDLDRQLENIRNLKTSGMRDNQLRDEFTQRTGLSPSTYYRRKRCA